MMQNSVLYAAFVAGLVLALLTCGCTDLSPGDENRASGPGVVTYVLLGDGFWGITGSDKEMYYPLNLDEEFRIDGLPVTFGAEIRENVSNSFGWGTGVEITDIKRTADTRDSIYLWEDGIRTYVGGEDSPLMPVLSDTLNHSLSLSRLGLSEIADSEILGLKESSRFIETDLGEPRDFTTFPIYDKYHTPYPLKNVTSAIFFLERRPFGDDLAGELYIQRSGSAQYRRYLTLSDNNSNYTEWIDIVNAMLEPGSDVWSNPGFEYYSVRESREIAERYVKARDEYVDNFGRNLILIGTESGLSPYYWFFTYEFDMQSMKDFTVVDRARVQVRVSEGKVEDVTLSAGTYEGELPASPVSVGPEEAKSIVKSQFPETRYDSITGKLVEDADFGLLWQLNASSHHGAVIMTGIDPKTGDLLYYYDRKTVISTGTTTISLNNAIQIAEKHIWSKYTEEDLRFKEVHYFGTARSEEGEYSVSFRRYLMDIPCVWDDVVVDVDARTGKIPGYRKRWTVPGKDIFVNTSPTITQDKAEELFQAFMQEEYSTRVDIFSTRLAWMTDSPLSDDESCDVRLVWWTIFDDSPVRSMVSSDMPPVLIDAHSGEILRQAYHGG